MEPAAAFHSVWKNQGGPSVCSLVVSIVVKDVQVERPKSGASTMFFCREQGYWDLWRLNRCFLVLALFHFPFFFFFLLFLFLFYFILFFSRVRFAPLRAYVLFYFLFLCSFYL